jgi:hypothetical protein
VTDADLGGPGQPVGDDDIRRRGASLRPRQEGYWPQAAHHRRYIGLAASRRGNERSGCARRVGGVEKANDADVPAAGTRAMAVTPGTTARVGAAIPPFPPGTGGLDQLGVGAAAVTEAVGDRADLCPVATLTIHSRDYERLRMASELSIRISMAHFLLRRLKPEGR